MLTHEAEFPKQKISTSAKSEKWGKECIDGAEKLALWSDYRIRQDYYNKKKNYDLANDIIDIKDVESVCSPLGLKLSSFPATMQNYPLANPKIKLLVGEEAKRRFDFKVRSTNPNLVTKKREEYKNAVLQVMGQALQDENLPEEKLKEELAKIQEYYKYSSQEMSEKMATDILNYFYKKLDLKRKFNSGFQDALIVAEEIYRVGIVAGEPIVVKCNPLNLFTYGTGHNADLDEADIIIEDGFYPVGEVIDEFYDFLKPADIDYLEGDDKRSGASKKNDINYNHSFPMMRSDIFSNEFIDVKTEGAGLAPFGGFRDEVGNIRVVRVTWKSRRKIGKLSYFNEFGEVEEKLVDENYKPNEQFGETVKWLWVNEYWEGTRIGEDIYVKIQPKEVQFRSMNNISKCRSGYIGTAYNINASRARSLYDQMKPYQYLYNIFMYRTELAFAKYKGPIMEINQAAIPENMSLEDFLYYAEVMGYMLLDPFNEGKKGAAQGTMAGSMNTVGGKILSDQSIASYIQSNLEMLRYLEHQIGIISGVSEQRQGQIESRELVGNVERAVTQSAHITEPWFSTHEGVKLRVLSALLDTAKFCYRTETDKTIQYVLDDMSTSMIKMNGEILNSSDYNLFANNSSKDMEFEQALKQLAQAGLQNDKLTFTDLIKIYQSNNMTEISKYIQNAEERRQQMLQEQQQKELENQQQMQQVQAETQERLMQMQIENREDEQAAKIMQIRIQGEEDRKTLMLQKTMESDTDTSSQDYELAIKELEESTKLKTKELEDKKKLKEKELSDNKELKNKELDLQREIKNKEVEVKKIAARNKPKPTSK
jgi:hypothetical protein